MKLESLQWLELQSQSNINQIKMFEEDKEVESEVKPKLSDSILLLEQNLPNYIDPVTRLPYDPFRENSSRGKKLALLLTLRAVLP